MCPKKNDDLVLNETVDATHQQLSEGIKKIQAALEAGMYGESPERRDLKNLLGKLGIKSARTVFGSLSNGVAFQMESLDATLKQVTFDDKHIKLWKTNATLPK